MAHSIKRHALNALLVTAVSTVSFNAGATAPMSFDNLSQSKFIFQLGGFRASEGQSKFVNINTLIGDYFSISNQHQQNGLVGLGYYVHGFDKNQFTLMYGLDAYYLANTSVQGNVTQERLFTNLSYSYDVTNYPIYLAVKGFMHMNSDKYVVTADAGIGPNFIQTGDFHEKSLDGGMTLPDNIFTGQTNTVFSGMLGVGVKFNKVFGEFPVEVGYRFFYLGQSSLKKTTNQVFNTLNTGNTYANALVFSISAP